MPLIESRPGLSQPGSFLKGCESQKLVWLPPLLNVGGPEMPIAILRQAWDTHDASERRNIGIFILGLKFYYKLGLKIVRRILVTFYKEDVCGTKLSQPAIMAQQVYAGRICRTARGLRVRWHSLPVPRGKNPHSSAACHPRTSPPNLRAGCYPV